MNENLNYWRRFACTDVLNFNFFFFVNKDNKQCFDDTISSVIQVFQIKKEFNLSSIENSSYNFQQK